MGMTKCDSHDMYVTSAQNFFMRKENPLKKEIMNASACSLNKKGKGIHLLYKHPQLNRNMVDKKYSDSDDLLKIYGEK